MVAQSPFKIGPEFHGTGLLLSLLHILLRKTSCFLQWRKVPFQALFKNIGEKLAFRKGGFLATLLFAKGQEFLLWK